jgi:hypothetical protein
VIVLLSVSNFLFSIILKTYLIEDACQAHGADYGKNQENQQLSLRSILHMLGSDVCFEDSIALVQIDG